MSPFANSASSGRILGLVGIFTFAGMSGAAPAAPNPAQAPHIWVTAAETLCRRNLSEACKRITDLGLATADLWDSDRVQLHLLSAIYRLEAGDENSARKAIGEALKLDREARMPAFASARASELLEDVRARIPLPRTRPRPPTDGPAREAPARAMARAFDALYQGSQFEAAELMLDLATHAQPLSRDDQAQVAMRRGIVSMERGDEERAASAFQQAQELDPRIRLPGDVPPKTLRTFEDVRNRQAGTSSRAPGPTDKAAQGSASKPEGPQFEPVGTALLVGGGVALAAGTIIVIASSGQDPPPTVGQVVGGAIGVVGIASMVGGLYISFRPEVLALRVTVTPVDQGGVLTAVGRF